MTARRSLNLKVAISVLAAFVVSMAFSWFLHNHLSRNDAYKLIDRTFESVENEVGDCVNDRLVRQCMAVREMLEDGHATDVKALQDLARELRVTEISIADAKGDIVASSVPEYLAGEGRQAFSFVTAGGQAEDMMCLVHGPDTEFCQPLRSNTANGVERKFVGVWRPEGGFVEIGCDKESLRSLARSSIVDLFRNWRVGGAGGIVVTTPTGLVLSDYDEPNREGTQWQDPDWSFYWQKREIEGFMTYVMIPKISAAVQRDILVVSTALLNGAALVFVALLVGFVISVFVRRQLREQAAKEMEMSKHIQLAVLPSVFPPFPDEPRFDIRASMETAKDVGGDFYDFYYTGQDRVLFLVADVSGKGVPAAMFMMRAKTLIKSIAQTGKPLAQVFEEANEALCDGNTSNTFVTVWAGELNTRTGRVVFVNAGHNPPAVRRRGVVEFLRTRPSLVLGAMPGVSYRTGELQLEPGDVVYLYTDGIVEQPNESGELFGENRLLEVIARGARRRGEVLGEVLAAVRRYAADVEQADDRTQLAILYRGEPETVSGEYEPTIEGVAKASTDLAAALGSVPERTRNQIMVAADEIFANIARHSGATGWSLVVEKSHHPDSVRLVVSDDGVEFDPLSRPDPDTTLSAEERQIGGLGIFVVRKTMNSVTYKRRNGRNILSMRKDYGNQD